MTQKISGHKSPAEIGSLFAAVLAKANNADLITFDHVARHVILSHELPVLHIAKSIVFTGGSTRFNSIFPIMGAKYDRVIILSDMQSWNAPGWQFGGGPEFRKTIEQYCYKFKADPVIYSFDLNGYGTMQTPESKTFLLAGFSDKIFDVMKKLEEDKDALITAINAVEL